jgi:ABC-type Fe3+ transport system permease subunit
MLAFLSTITRNGVVKLVPGNSARNACWHFLAQSLGMGLLSSFLATAPEMLGWYVLTFTERSASARIHRCSISPRSIQGIVIYIFPRDGEVV